MPRLSSEVNPVHLSQMRAFTRRGRLFAVMSGYLDDSYDRNTVVIGGWIGDDATWDKIQSKWVARIAYESRVSIKRGLKPVTRYHASDCANRVNEFEGWSLPRQITLTKKLISIMTEYPLRMRPMVFAFGFSLSEARRLYPETSQETILRDMYRYCTVHCLREIGRVMHRYFTNERITFIHDGGDKPGGSKGTLFRPALEGYEFVRRDETILGAKQFVTFAPMAWRDCPLLEPADMVAFDSFKTINQRLHKNPQAAIRRSLEALIGKGAGGVIGNIKPGAFTEFVNDWNKENPIQ